MTPDATTNSGGSDDEQEWEEVAMPPVAQEPLDVAEDGVLAHAGQTIEITLDKDKEKAVGDKPKGLSYAERVVRLESHKLHTLCLLSNASIRNKWINDPLLHARLMSLTPLPLQNSFSMIHKKNQPDAVKRGRLFEAALMRLATWWYSDFELLEGGVASYTFDEIAAGVLDDMEDEVIRSPKSLMKHALQWEGTRDTSAQLFTALCRALGIPARLVVSLQSVPWQASVGKPKAPSKKKKKKHAVKPQPSSSSEEEDDMEEVKIPGPSHLWADDLRASPSGNSSTGDRRSKGKGKAKAEPAPIINLRKSKLAGRTLGSSSPLPSAPLDMHRPPVFWTEVFSRPDGRWMPVDPIHALVNKKKMFEPHPLDRRNRMTYVVAFEEDGFARDVTARYAHRHGPQLWKSRVRSKGSTKRDWWEKVMSLLTRPYRLHRDDLEDQELHVQQLVEGMPTSLSGFKDNPIYVLERHLRRDEVIHPKTEIGRFRGEPVYSRANVLALKTAENWMRRGRAVRAGQQPLKSVPMRAATLGRLREVEMRGEDALQGLYAHAQTELYRTPPVVDGKVPKNDFGNIDLYTPSMLPEGAVHVAHKGTAKVARQLGIDYAEAVVSTDEVLLAGSLDLLQTGFEFKKRRALPILNGIVIAAEHEDELLEAYWSSIAESEEKERAKRRERVLKRWTKLIHGLRIRQRMQEQYASEGNAPITVTLDEPAGGFMTELDEIVQPFSLPKMQHVVVDYASNRPNVVINDIATEEHEQEDLPAPELAASVVGSDEDMEEVVAVVPIAPPKTMEELAAEEHEAELAASTALSRPQRPRAAQTVAARNGSATRTPPTHGRKRAHRDSTSSLSDVGSDFGAAVAPAKRTVGGRTLRPRVPKSAERVKQEKEIEAAFRHAVAE